MIPPQQNPLENFTFSEEPRQFGSAAARKVVGLFLDAASVYDRGFRNTARSMPEDILQT